MAWFNHEPAYMGTLAELTSPSSICAIGLWQIQSGAHILEAVARAHPSRMRAL
jgi:hypothetical protein